MYNPDNYSKSTFIDKLDNAIQYRYNNEENNTDNKRNREFYDDFRRKYPDSIDISQAVRSWRSFSENNKTRLPSVKQLMQICNVLDCDIDYFLTEQTELRKDIANSSDITGLKYESIDFLNTISKSQSPLVQMTMQFLDLALSSKDNYNDTITSLACIVFHLDDAESEQIASTYDTNTNKDSKGFIDETNLKDYYLNYGGKYYNDSMRDQYYDSMLLLELNKGLERLKNQERKYRHSYKGNVEVVILEEDYENEENYIFEDDEEQAQPLKGIKINITKQKTTSF